MARDCKFQTLAELRGEPFERWLTLRTAETLSARTRNAYREAWVVFGDWCIESARLTANPLLKLPKATVNTDRRRQRRSLTEDELQKPLAVARTRPLADTRGALDVLPSLTTNPQLLPPVHAPIGCNPGQSVSSEVKHGQMSEELGEVHRSDEKRRNGNKKGPLTTAVISGPHSTKLSQQVAAVGFEASGRTLWLCWLHASTALLQRDLRPALRGSGFEDNGTGLGLEGQSCPTCAPEDRFAVFSS